VDLRKVAAGLTVVTATVCAVLPIGATYASGLMLLLLCGAAVVGAAATAALRAARLPATAAILGSLVGMGGAILALAGWLPRPAGSLLGAAVRAMRQSGAIILTSAIPVPVRLETVALPVCVTWLTATTIIVLLTSTRPASAGLPPVVLFAGAVAFVGPTASPSYGYAAALVVALVFFLGVLGWTGSGRLAAAGVAMVAALIGAGTLWAAPAVLAGAESQPPDPRAHVVPPYQNPEQVNPLRLLSGWAAEPGRSLLEVRSDQATRLRWVTLSDFTGVTWLPAPSYRAAGVLLPATQAAGTTQVREEVSVTGLTGGWLPVPAGAREVRGVRVAIDVDSATLAAPDGLAEGIRYTVEAAPPSWSANQLSSAGLPAEESYDRYRELPAGEPARLHEIAKLAAGTGTPYQQAKRLEAYLRKEYRFDPGAPGGNGYPSLNRFLTGTPAEDGGRGTSEQFATAFAVLARALGIPARVVVGFKPGQSLGGDRYLVQTTDALAWAEVYLEDVGWVPFDPTPEKATVDDAPTMRPQPGAPTPSVQATPDGGSDEDDILGDAADTALPPPVEDPAGDAWLVSLTASAGVLFAGLVILVGLRLRRSGARLGRGQPSDRVLGAWAELRDGLRLAGRRPAAQLVVGEVAGLAAEAVNPQLRHRAGTLAAAVNAAGFSGAMVTPADADQVVADVRAFRRALRRGAKFGRRLIWWIDPRPLWWR